MSEVKAPKKGAPGSKQSETKKTEVKKTETEQSTTPAETTSTDKPANKADATPKSASQSSISHFSSVSTPAYRSGWNSIFGGGEAAEKSKSKRRSATVIPDHLAIADEDIDAELRNILYEVFSNYAHKKGVNFSKINKSTVIEYNLECSIKEK